MRENTVAEPLSPEEERGLRLAIGDDDTAHISVEHARRLLATLEAARLTPETEALPSGQREWPVVLKWWQDQALALGARAERAEEAAHRGLAATFQPACPICGEPWPCPTYQAATAEPALAAAPAPQPATPLEPDSLRLFMGHHPACPFTVEGDPEACLCGASKDPLVQRATADWWLAHLDEPRS